jgi:hypothetical protein
VPVPEGGPPPPQQAPLAEPPDLPAVIAQGARDQAPLLAARPPLVPDQDSAMFQDLTPSEPDQALATPPDVAPRPGISAAPTGAAPSASQLGIQRALESVPAAPSWKVHSLARHGSLESPPGPFQPARHAAAGTEREREAVAVEGTVTVQRLHHPTGAAPAALPLAGGPPRRPEALIPGELLDPRSTALGSGAATLDEDGAVVFAPPAGEGPGLPQPSASPAPVLQRAPADQPVDTAPAAPGAAAPPGGPPAADLDELARRLYDRLRLRLRAELRLDRERSGHLTDLRH